MYYQSRWISAFVICAPMLTPALGQSDLSSVSGTVRDATGAIVAGAGVTVKNEETGFQRPTLPIFVRRPCAPSANVDPVRGWNILFAEKSTLECRANTPAKSSCPTGGRSAFVRGELSCA